MRRAEGPIPSRRLAILKFDALVFDPAALGEDSWEYLSEVAGGAPLLGLIVCTGRSTVQDRVRGLRLGVDDWITKPMAAEEVTARIEAVTRGRSRPIPADPRPLRFGELEIRPAQAQAFLTGVSIGLTPREFEVLHLLASSSGRVFERDEIYARIWGYSMAPGDRLVDVFVRKIRQKLLARVGRECIRTHFRIGYRFDADPELRAALPGSRAGAATGRAA